jgi:hypothetical protein
MKRILLAAVLGGLIVFVWSAIAHMVTPLGMMGLSMLAPADETRVADALRTSVPKSGMYFLPGFDMSHHPTKAEEEQFAAKMKQGPSGLLIITASGGVPLAPSQLIWELVTNIVAAYIAAVLAAMMVGSYMRRAFAITLLAVFATVSLSLSYWIWYKFPAAFVLGELITELVGWFLAGVAIAKIVPPADRAS